MLCDVTPFIVKKLEIEIGIKRWKGYSSVMMTTVLHLVSAYVLLSIKENIHGLLEAATIDTSYVVDSYHMLYEDRLR